MKGTLLVNERTIFIFDPVEKIYDTDKVCFFFNSAKPLTSGLETMFIIIAHPIKIGSRREKLFSGRTVGLTGH